MIIGEKVIGLIGMYDYNKKYFIIYDNTVYVIDRLSAGDNCSFSVGSKKGIDVDNKDRLYIKGNLTEFEKRLIPIEDLDKYSEYMI